MKLRTRRIVLGVTHEMFRWIVASTIRFILNVNNDRVRQTKRIQTEQNFRLLLGSIFVSVIMSN